MFSASVGNVRRINPDEVDALLANELTQLSFQDRESMQDEIHGIGTVAQTETPEMVQNAVLAVLEAIQRIPVKRAYETALRRNSTLVLDNQAFFLQFLRAELFDAEKAAVRMLMYLEMVVEYYGEDALLRPMMLCDLGNEEMQLLREGRCQLTSRDRFGRRIICTVGAFGSRYSAYSRIKVAMYLMGTIATTDEQTQVKGMTFVMFPCEELIESVGDAHERGELIRWGKSMPVRISAFHICLRNANPIDHVVKACTLLILPKQYRARVRVHIGTATECLYKLMTFGIPVKDLPIDESGQLKAKSLESWIKVREALDTALQENRLFDGVECPLLHDVLFCNGGNKWSFPANIVFREILESKRIAYLESRRNSEKRIIIQDIIKQVIDMNGRFLAWNSQKGWWILLASVSKELRDKVGVALRDHYKRVKAKSLSNPEQQVSQRSNSTTMATIQDQRKRKRLDNEAFGCFCGGFES